MNLRPYQEVGRDFLAGRRFALLADEMRVGKTPQAILAAHAIGAENILVVCPAIAVPQWYAEFEKWWPQDQSTPTTTAISFDHLVRHSVDYVQPGYDVVIVDECHFARNPDAKRTKLIYGKGGLGWHTKRMWALSGTPAVKHAAELWPMLCAFGVTKLSYPEFVHRYCALDWMGKIKGTKPARIPELRKLLDTVMLRRTRKEVAPEMPGISYSTLNVEPIVQVDIQVPAGLPDADLAAWLELRPTFDRENRIAVAKAKALPLVEEIAFALDNDLLPQTVVFGWHIEPLEAVVAGLRKRGIKAELLNGATSPARRALIQAEFLAGRIQVIVANILAAGTAIDLSAASHGYFLELDWLPANNTQAANRLVNMQKAEPVTIDVLTVPGTTDDRIQKVLLQRSQELGKLY